MSHLRPCPACDRHVRAHETTCPFCDGPLGVDVSTPILPGTRVSRAARMAFGAAVSASLVAGCGNTKPASSGGGEVTADAGEATPTADAGVPEAAPPVDYGPAKPYGAPPADGLLV